MITRVTEDVFRGPHPEVMSDLSALGIKTILSLQTGAQEILRNEIYSEDHRAEKLGIRVVHERLSNFFPPNELQVFTCLSHMTGQTGPFRSHEPEKLPIYVHCKHGVDRTGFICAAYRVLIQGWEIEDALEEMYELGHHRWFYWYWTPAFRKRMAEMRPMFAEVRS